MSVVFSQPDQWDVPRMIRHLEQVGIDFRQSGEHAAMRDYIEHLKSELRMTEQFLREDQKGLKS